MAADNAQAIPEAQDWPIAAFSPSMALPPKAFTFSPSTVTLK
jgi:hypothetical protein